MTVDSVDKFVKSKVPVAHRGTVAAVRRVMREVAPKASETFSYMMPVWKAGEIVAYLSASKKDVTLGFVGGNDFEDKYDLLKGRGSSTRHLKFKTPDDVKKNVIGYYVRQSLKRDKKRASK